MVYVPGDADPWDVDALTANRGGVRQPAYVSGRWYFPPYPQSLAAGSAPAANTIRLQPFVLSRAVTITDLAAKVTTLSAGGNFQLAVYANDPATMRPTGSPLAATGNISTAAVGNIGASLATPVVLPAGIYWMALNQDNSTAIYLTSSNNANGGLSSLAGSATLANLGGATSCKTGLNTPQTFGTWPNLSSATFTEAPGISADAVIMFKVQ
jgi:hypothetical protein